MRQTNSTFARRVRSSGGSPRPPISVCHRLIVGDVGDNTGHVQRTFCMQTAPALFGAVPFTKGASAMGTGPGRNDPCPCGSGKKYKKCHGAAAAAVGQVPAREGPDHPITPALPRSTESISVDIAGFPGRQQHWVIVNKFKPEARKPSSPAGHEGTYRVVYVLSRPGQSPTKERDFSFDLLAQGTEGDSHLSMSPPRELVQGEGDRIELHIDTNHAGRHLQFACHPNRNGFIARIETTTNAASFADADLTASAALSPFLSLWSVTQNVPVHVHQTEITETRTGNRRVTITMPYYDAPPPLIPDGISTEFLWFAALYREALNSNSPLYQFFCLYKIIEGVMVRRGVTKTGPKKRERIPDDPAEFNAWLHALFPVRPAVWDPMALDSVFIPEVRGRTVGDIRNNELRTLRNDVGHLFDESDKTLRLWLDDAAQMNRVHHWLPITMCIARLVLKNEFPETFLSGLAEDGTDIGLKRPSAGVEAEGNSQS
jgi:hypothetical protein